tara:strand:- start:256 stop:651 length:396 start_codon:yes stop_codon:yes gene_type:complete
LSDKDNVPKKRGRGRPRKSEVESKKKRGVIGRPPGEAARIKEFHARLLATSGETVINTIISKALNDDDKDQVACLKMCIDRVLPMSYFEKGRDAGRGSVNIQISMLGDAKAEVLDQDELQDIEYEDVDVES